jgi:Na+/H+ antiporter NhaD/arsenite permease-like protein
MTYLGLALGRVPGFRIDRTGMAIVGAAAAVATGAIAWDRAVAAVDAHTLILLFGMMVVGAYLRLSGFFALVTRQTVRLARTPVALLGLLVLFAGLFVVIGAVEDSGSPRISSPWRAGPTSTSRPSSSP